MHEETMTKASVVLAENLLEDEDVRNERCSSKGVVLLAALFGLVAAVRWIGNQQSAVSDPTIVTALQQVHSAQQWQLPPLARSWQARAGQLPQTTRTHQLLASRPAVPIMAVTAPAHFHEPAQRDTHYGAPLNVAKYLIDMHDGKAVFNFCGSHLFQLSLSPKLREHLEKVAQKEAGQQPMIFDASADSLAKTPGYAQTADADNIRIFHGREIRQSPTAEGGQGKVLQLCLANGDDPEGWTKQEIGDYNGWAHDSGRPWRKGAQLEQEGFEGFKSKFGEAAFTLHHRFYLHFDHRNQMWLSAEDGCEGEPHHGRKMFDFGDGGINVFGFR
eukprot:gnl/TRDRNA2_/TRDRNA2_193373_c0_seq1.p1 gnl/TRDRNA2_/TRDRNA2_193373_c0~~gnl/TRDRNA2_/TRDRNA2_193373_c0_seq1.p1  ORF type:complete len:330 (+),score=64.74 gnl/TRDRNA2_/TRDRNA2_193373_c0_seq1:29-1018(+)